MKKFVLLVLACILLLSLVASSVSAETSPEYHTTTPDEVKMLLDDGWTFTVLDVRRADEYAESHIPGAINLPNEAITDARPEMLSELDSPIVVYCRSGRRSQEAANKLLKLGYTLVFDMGGIQDWPYETISGAEPGAWQPLHTEADHAASDGMLGHFHTMDLNGNPVDQSILAGYNLTMVNVWATYCGPCLSEMPDLGELAAEYKDKGVQIMGLVSDVLDYDGNLSESQIQTAQDVVSATHADYPHIVPSEDLFGILSQISSVPTTFFVDQNGNQVGYAYIGSQSIEDWRSIIEETLAEVKQ